MATKRMLVDAIHPEETRIVVTSGNRLEEFDFESASRRQLRGNIYLAKVTRVEPSLQAAFVDYGGNRHGFLAFSEIHPDYYQIPVADREALLQAQEDEDHAEAQAETDSETSVSETVSEQPGENGDAEDEDNGNTAHAEGGEENVENVGGDDALEEVPQRRRAQPRKYKIQEVIKRRQVMLVQVVKEERGNKGAALTTYLSLAGRYSVLMPNTARGGGISRKITNASDRKRLKEIASGLDVPKGMGVILRTAGASRTKAEVKRDFEYLMRLWENVRTLTLQSTAPCLVYEEGSLIKRTIRDLYSKDIDEVVVAGDNAYREAKDFMRMIMPSHARNVKPHKDPQPIFSKHGIESQLDSMFSPQVTLPSGGYIVINPTEALVSIDVNSGRATKEHNIEDTALQTNLEAAEEVSRQLRLRDLAGLIVIDFIDMEEKRSNRLVERKLKDCLKNDRARIQVGRISHFGLMEMSRQRIRFGVVESSTHTCPVCHGAGVVRSVESLALMVMRAIEDHLLRKSGNPINVRVPVDVALYLLNAKRASLMELEGRHGLSITVSADAKLTGSQFAIERGESRPVAATEARHVSVDTAEMDEPEAEEAEAPEEEAREQGGKRRRRRRRRGGQGAEDRGESQGAEAADAEEATEEAADAEAQQPGDGEQPARRRRRGRRGGRRNRRNQGAESTENAEATETADASGDTTGHAPLEAEGVAEVEAPVAAQAAESASVTEPETSKADAEAASVTEENAGDGAEAPAETAAEEKPKKPRRSRRKKAEPEVVQQDAAGTEPSASESPAPQADVANSEAKLDGEEQSESAVDEKRPASRRKKALPPDEIVVTSSSGEDEDNKGKPKRVGWWQRGFFG